MTCNVMNATSRFEAALLQRVLVFFISVETKEEVSHMEQGTNSEIFADGLMSEI